MVKLVALNYDSTVMEFGQSLGTAVVPSGRNFNVYLPFVWRDSDHDNWQDSNETAYLWLRTTGTFYYLAYGSSDFQYPGWSRWYGWYDSYHQMHAVYDMSFDYQISGEIKSYFYSSKSPETIPPDVDIGQLTGDVVRQTQLAR